MQRVISMLFVAGSLLGCSGGLGGSDAGDAGVPTPDCDGGAITITSNIPSCMWAPDHSMVLFDLSDLTITATGTCTAPTLSIVGVTSNQPPLGGGQGNFTPDYTFNSSGVCLRSERQGTSSADRIYSITVQATEGTLTVEDVITVTVPHDQGGTKCPSVDPSRVVPDGDPRCN
jgi:hypothetical protein